MLKHKFKIRHYYKVYNVKKIKSVRLLPAGRLYCLSHQAIPSFLIPLPKGSHLRIFQTFLSALRSCSNTVLVLTAVSCSVSLQLPY